MKVECFEDDIKVESDIKLELDHSTEDPLVMDEPDYEQIDIVHNPIIPKVEVVASQPKRSAPKKIKKIKQANILHLPSYTVSDKQGAEDWKPYRKPVPTLPRTRYSRQARKDSAPTADTE